MFYASYSGFVNGDTATVLSGSPALNTSAVTNSPVGTFAITVAQGTLSATNYGFSFTNGVLTVGKAGTSVAVSSSKNPSGFKDSVVRGESAGRCHRQHNLSHQQRGVEHEFLKQWQRQQPRHYESAAWDERHHC